MVNPASFFLFITEGCADYFNSPFRFNRGVVLGS